MGFKEQLEEDIETTFFNQDEFGELASINDRKMLVVRDDESLQEYNSKTTDDLAKGNLLIHVKMSYFKHAPQAEKLMKYDGVTYKIISVTKNIGVLTILLGRYTG